MVQDEKKTNSMLVADDLEPYRRLVDLQKQMIELVRQHERTKNECAALRTQLLNEMAKRNPRWNLRRFTSRLPALPRCFSEKWRPRLENRPHTSGSFLSSC